MVTRAGHDVTLYIGLDCGYCMYVLFNYGLIHEVKSHSVLNIS